MAVGLLQHKARIPLAGQSYPAGHGPGGVKHQRPRCFCRSLSRLGESESMRLFLALERRSVDCGMIKPRHRSNIGAMALPVDLKVMSRYTETGSLYLTHLHGGIAPRRAPNRYLTRRILE